jgi:hypothetical protein
MLRPVCIQYVVCGVYTFWYFWFVCSFFFGCMTKIAHSTAAPVTGALRGVKQACSTGNGATLVQSIAHLPIVGESLVVVRYCNVAQCSAVRCVEKVQTYTWYFTLAPYCITVQTRCCKPMLVCFYAPPPPLLFYRVVVLAAAAGVLLQVVHTCTKHTTQAAVQPW